MSSNPNTPGRSGGGRGRRGPRDAPQMTEEQREALCDVPDLYNDPRSLVQIWRDAGVPYHDQLPHHRRTETGSSLASSVTSNGSGRSGSYSQAFASTGSPAPRHNAMVPYGGGYTNGTQVNGDGLQMNGNSTQMNGDGNHMDLVANGPGPALTSPTPQPSRPARVSNGMGDPATAFFIPGDQDTTTNATRAANADAYRQNGNIQPMFDWSMGMNGVGSAPPAGLPAPGFFGNNLEDVFRSNGANGEQNHQRHRRHSSRFGSNTPSEGNGSNGHGPTGDA